MRHAIAITLLAATVSAQTDLYDNSMNPNQGVQFIDGFTQGAFHRAQIQSTSECVKDVQGVMKDIKVFIEEASDSKVRALATLVRQLGNIISDIEYSVKDCLKISASDKNTLVQMSNTLGNPSKLSYEAGKHLIVNGIDILAEINNFIKAFNNGSFVHSGEQLGEAASLVLFGKLSLDFQAEEMNNLQLTKSDVVRLVQGLFVGALGSAIPDVTNCINDTSAAFRKFSEAIADFKKGGASNMMAGVKASGQAVEMFAQDVQTCQGIVQPARELIEEAKAFANPKSFIYHIGKDLVHNGKDIYSEIKDAVSQYQSGDYFALGKDIGTALEKTFIGNEAIEFSAFSQ